MKRSSLLLVSAVALALLAGCGKHASGGGSSSTGAGSAQRGPFDYYLLSLSWSPQYCGTIGGEHADPQCAPDRHYGFVVHGLWPQNEHGQNPRACPSEEKLDNQTLQSMLDIMPSDMLIRHEWGSHGVCTGLNAKDFFAKTRTAFNQVKIPAKYKNPDKSMVVKVKEFREDLIKANDGLSEDKFAIYCDNRFLREVRVCVEQDLRFRSCGANIRNACGLDEMVLRAVR